MSVELTEPVELGTWIGRAQAFGFIANHCSVGQAQNLRRIREAAAYRLLNITWEDFCREHAGLSRPRVDELIRSLEEFGENYFRLAGIVRISADAYRQIEPRIHGEHLEIDGELVEIVPENAVRIRHAIIRLRADLRAARDLAERESMPAIADLHHRLDRCFHEMKALASSTLSETETAGYRGLVNFAQCSLQRLLKNLPE